MKPLPLDYNPNSNQPNKASSTNIDTFNSSSSNSVKIPAYAWKMLAILSSHCNYGNVCRNYVDPSYT